MARFSYYSRYFLISVIPLFLKFSREWVKFDIKVFVTVTVLAKRLEKVLSKSLMHLWSSKMHNLLKSGCRILVLIVQFANSSLGRTKSSVKNILKRLASNATCEPNFKVMLQNVNFWKLAQYPRCPSQYLRRFGPVRRLWITYHGDKKLWKYGEHRSRSDKICAFKRTQLSNIGK